MDQLRRFVELDAKGILEKMRLCLIKKLLPDLEDRRKYHEEFVSSSSFHGVHNIVHTKSKARRALWLLIVTGCLAIVIWQICSRFIYYFSWPTTTTLVVQYVENVKFPAVTFCNLNRNYESRVKGSEEKDKFTDEPTLGYTDAGITFVIHSPHELPRFDGLGLLTPVGMHAQVAIRQLKSIIQEYPWGECKPDIKLQYHKIYSTNGCLLECKARYIQDWCGCLPFILPGKAEIPVFSKLRQRVNHKLKGNGTECDLLKFYKCVYPAVYDIEIKGLCTVGTHNSTCPAPCEETDYPTTVTYSNFGGENAIKYFSTKLKKSPEYIRQNLVRIEIKYHDLSYKITQQQKALTISELLVFQFRQGLRLVKYLTKCRPCSKRP
ncbi:Acid-sensing ion channel 5 [Turdus rufiventris]|nr:Acid-sensing ion channel 5 [Turdus rufiventris]